jgi:hypothetical protein
VSRRLQRRAFASLTYMVCASLIELSDAAVAPVS